MPRGVRALTLLAGIAVAGLAPARVFATDGVIEINQTCATQTGCPAGAENPGFPVSLFMPGSYRLTSNLTVPANTGGISISGDGVAIDLNGFEIAGPFVCNSGSCAYGNGGGVIGSASVGRASVRNGAISGFAGNGILLGDWAIVENVTLTNLGGGAIYLRSGGLALANRVAYVGRTGLSFTGIGGVFRDNVFYETGRGGVYTEAVSGDGGKATGGNWCGDGSCSRRGTRRYYLTKGTFNGASTLNACDTGFHFASLWEIWAFGTLEYDVRRGYLVEDSGGGPPAPIDGWVRTGFSSSNSSNPPGAGNCNAWTSSLSTVSGSRSGPFWVWDAASESISPWQASTSSCTTSLRVWCVED